MQRKIENLGKMAKELLAADVSSEKEKEEWGKKVQNLLQELSIYHFELEHRNAELEQSEHEFADSNAKYIELFENAPVGYVIIDKQLIVQQANQTFIDLYVPLYPRGKSVLGCKFSEFVCPEFQNTFHLFCSMFSHSGSILPIELKLWDSFEKPRYVIITAGKREKGDELFRLTINDIHTQKKLEMQLLDAKGRAEENDRKKTIFLTDISHELRAPLDTMTVDLEALENPKLSSEEKKKHLASAQDVLLSLRTQADEVMDFSFLNSGAFPLRHIDIDIAKICREHVLLARRKAQEKGISIVCEMDNMPILLGDPARIGTIIHSVLKYAVTRVVAGCIQMHGSHTQSPGGEGLLVLEFSGENISLEQDRKEVGVNGDGIGFLLARQELKAMKGRIMEMRSPNLLRLEIPLPKSSTLAVSASVIQEVPPEPAMKTCLLIDDVMLNLKVLAALMRKLNCSPFLATSGKEALKVLSNNHIDLILTDLWMPVMNGIEFAKIVRQTPKYNNIPIIAVTADMERMQSSDMHYFAGTFIKPVSMATIKEKLLTL